MGPEISTTMVFTVLNSPFKRKKKEESSARTYSFEQVFSHLEGY